MARDRFHPLLPVGLLFLIGALWGFFFVLIKTGVTGGVAPMNYLFWFALIAGTVGAVEAAGYAIAVTTEMALLGSAPPSRLELPRLDAFYLRRPGVLERWGTESFRRFVWFRAGARLVRGVLARSGMPL